MTIQLLEGTLEINIYYECEDQDLEDNICVRIVEDCPTEERLLRAGETNIYLTPSQAKELGEALLNAAHHSDADQF